MLLHQTCHPVLAAELTKFTQVMIDTGTTVNTPAGKVRPADEAHQPPK
jgi:hypothetical protein